MTFTPLVSVVITCYNYGKYLEQAIQSMLDSSFQDFEIIVVDDGSTDAHTIAVLKKLNKPKTRLIRQPNQGVAAARNRGISEAKGKYILPLDADDMFHPTYLEKAVWILETYPEVGFVSCWVKAYGTEKWVNRLPVYNFYKHLFQNIACGNSMFRKEAWKQAGGYKQLGYEDWELWIAMGENGWCGYSLFEPLFFYRRHGRSRVHYVNARKEKHMTELRSCHPNLYDPANLQALKQKWQTPYIPSPTQQDVTLNKDVNSYLTKPAPVEKMRVLFIIPRLNLKALDSRFMPFLEKFSLEKNAITIVTTMKAKHVDFEKFGKITKDIFQFPLLFQHYHQRSHFWLQMLIKLIVSRGIEQIYINNSMEGYLLLPKLKVQFPHIPVISLFPLIDMLADWDYKRVSSMYDPYIDVHVVSTKDYHTMVVHKNGINPSKIVDIGHFHDKTLQNGLRFENW